MTRILLLPAAALLSLAGCNSEPETIVQGPVDPMADELANAAPVTLPPAVSASVSFRCKDNSLAFVDFFDGSFVNYKAERRGPPVRLEKNAEGEGFTGNGYTVTGTPEEITLKTPEGETKDCHA
ncbi:hypothetical protein D1610_06145 [Sphingomonas gilva]|uniref:C-type lysozyme inhibitor domain-containing protein n=1 Tax=Sphingomonas gilva TaxID=2305907 RepID=A0A396RUI6_9SPHN|nr:hypothetical protein [Sphingomonas gilva]RHW18073.1 hypothetical protein D1610_06145 [Sphingomonas gilva]